MRMIAYFIPIMTHITAMPLFTHLLTFTIVITIKRSIPIIQRTPPIIDFIMSIDTSIFIMFDKGKWTISSFIEKKIEIFIELIIMQQFRFYFLLIMSMRTIKPIFTFVSGILVMLAEGLFVGVLVVGFFDTGVRVLAVFTIWTNLLFKDIRTHLFGIEIPISLFVFFCMEIWAVGIEVGVCLFTWSSFKIIDIQ